MDSSLLLQVGHGRRKDIIEKIMSRVFVCPDSSCWIWTGPNSGKGRGGGYARMSLFGQTVAVHKVLYVTVFGYVPGKKQLDHGCRARGCVNPWHQEVVTHKENQKRRAAARASCQ